MLYGLAFKSTVNESSNCLSNLCLHVPLAAYPSLQAHGSLMPILGCLEHAPTSTSLVTLCSAPAYLSFEVLPILMCPTQIPCPPRNLSGKFQSKIPSFPPLSLDPKSPLEVVIHRLCHKLNFDKETKIHQHYKISLRTSTCLLCCKAD